MDAAPYASPVAWGMPSGSWRAALSAWTPDPWLEPMMPAGWTLVRDPWLGPAALVPLGAAVEPHEHRLSGITSLDAGHLHTYGTTTGTALLADGSHVHMFEGVTSTEEGHLHYFRGVTGRSAPFLLGGHTHTFRAETTPSEVPRRHAHMVSGRTAIRSLPA